MERLFAFLVNDIKVYYDSMFTVFCVTLPVQLVCHLFFISIGSDDGWWWQLAVCRRHNAELGPVSAHDVNLLL